MMMMIRLYSRTIISQVSWHTREVRKTTAGLVEFNNKSQPAGLFSLNLLSILLLTSRVKLTTDMSLIKESTR